MFFAKVFSSIPVPSSLIKFGFSGVFCLVTGTCSGELELSRKNTRIIEKFRDQYIQKRKNKKQNQMYAWFLEITCLGSQYACVCVHPSGY